ncbi:hypothetical protein BO70DRAFT_424925 [Aspergillus heteromorphus CBS 117.55]|uniref:Uncharacterized protein n=1 Tax=Aspergillus heteromorphus CBS 117.55 TaxID=1448321 RepID=A0A317X0L4_9EURO|nr:uncharacterized protein BO70DRAFT_424925 [Aspergillus heteromorphus CBS 117.55]PWY92184.1 hypothetical protein BO70DRAFT_424925 [Aspergillus heteromorphus CBS 117.55]
MAPTTEELSLESIPKLRGMANYQDWLCTLQTVLNSKDRAYWGILSGEYQCPDKPSSWGAKVPTPREAFSPASSVFGWKYTPDRVSRETSWDNNEYEWNAPFKNHFDASVSEWKTMNIFLIGLLHSVVDESHESRILGLRNAPDIFHVLKSHYEQERAAVILQLYQKLTSLRCSTGDNRYDFLVKWRRTLADLKTLVDVPEWLEYNAFVTSLQGCASNVALLAPNNHNYLTANMMEVYSAFEHLALAEEKAPSVAGWVSPVSNRGWGSPIPAPAEKDW